VRAFAHKTSSRRWTFHFGVDRKLWAALTGDEITQAPSWKAYKEGLKWRDAFAHRLSGVPREQAEGFVNAAEQLAKHVEQVLADTFPDPVETPDAEGGAPLTSWGHSREQPEGGPRCGQLFGP
jgi:hypothetical protein